MIWTLNVVVFVFEENADRSCAGIARRTSAPSGIANAAMTRPAIASAHHHPNKLFTTSPTRILARAIVNADHEKQLPIADKWRGHGAIILHVLVDGTVAGALRLDEEIRPESEKAVTALQERAVQVVMITGEAETVAASVSTELGID